ncbi:hypothetical protein V5O48_007394 [Marasmius crinis-equi]|uniref:Uncharacterized protein n=1 Tax=Marasmius crinis-equi TaxID=585013 RepID=A0ABR3FGV3_9AGAR
MATSTLHPMAQEIKPLFFRLYNFETLARATSPHDSTSQSCSSSRVSTPSLGPLPSLSFSDWGTDTDSVLDLSECEEDVPSAESPGAGPEARLNEKQRAPPLALRDVDTSVDTLTPATPSSDLIPITPISVNFVFPHSQDGLSDRSSVTNAVDLSWYKPLLAGVSDETPYLEQLRYNYALKVVRTVPVWHKDDLEALARGIIWFAIKPELSESLSLRALKRVTLFAGAVKSAFLAQRGSEAYAEFVNTLVDISVGMFMGAWNIEADTPLFSRYLPVHIQTTIRLTAFIGDLYICGLMKHVCIRSCFFELSSHLDRFEALIALRVLLQVIGKGDSIFWRLDHADQLLYSGAALEKCGTSCSCLIESGITERPGFREGVVKHKMRYGKMFYERIMKARFASGGMPTWTHGGEAPAEKVELEIYIMFLQMGLLAK